MSQSSPYDLIAYPTRANPSAHPTYVASLGRLFGMDPAPIDTARVLELGCGSGDHLIPIAEAYPQATFVGVDAAGEPIRSGREVVDELGLTNIELHQADILKIDESWGRFDYVVAHGLYSWVPQEVRDQLLRICRRNLAPQGIAYVSYNAYPGWHLQNYLRDMMLYHGRAESESSRRIAKAHEMLAFVADGFPEADTNLVEFFRHSRKELTKANPNYLIHDHLAELNHPVYFHEFIERAGKFGLQYLWEAEFGDRVKSGVDPAVLQRLAGDLLVGEQYLDFLRCRRFRQTLLCSTEITLRRTPDHDAIRKLWISTTAAPDGDPDVSPNVPVSFSVPKTVRMTTDDALVKSALIVLRSLYPRECDFDELKTRTIEFAERMNGSPPRPTQQEIEADLCEMLFAGHLNGLVRLQSFPTPCRFDVGERPKASAYARLQCRKSVDVTSRRHLSLRFAEALGSQLLISLDGSRTVDELVLLMTEKVRNGELELPDAPDEGMSTAEYLHAAVRSALTGYAIEALLVE